MNSLTFRENFSLCKMLVIKDVVLAETVISGTAGYDRAAQTSYRQVTVVIFIPGYYNTFDATLQYIFCRTGRKKPVHPREKEPERMNEAWKELKQECAQCRRCGLGETRHSLVFGDGAENARIMLIGEGPGEQEDRQGVPFVGPAGKLAKLWSLTFMV